MKCPKCGYPQFCPCTACKTHLINTKWKPWVPTEDGQAAECVECGFTASHDQWLEIEIGQLEAEGKWPPGEEIESNPQG